MNEWKRNEGLLTNNNRNPFKHYVVIAMVRGIINKINEVIEEK